MTKQEEKQAVNLAYKMRYAENYLLETEDDSRKTKVIIKYNKLTPEQKEVFDEVCESMGV